MYSQSTNWTFEDTLSQIGLGYPILFYLGFKSNKIIYWVLGSLLFSYWLVFALYPVAANFNYAAVGVPADWNHLMQGFESHWNKNSNLAWAFDTWFLNLFPRESAFQYNGGGYATLSFIPTLGTMILGLLAGKILKAKDTETLKKFGIMGFGLIILSLIIHASGLNPIVKRIWTPNWTLLSGGFCFLFLALFHWIVDLKQIERPFFWLKIIGMNSIAAYVMAHTITSFIDQSFGIHIGQHYASFLGSEYETLISGTVILFFQWILLKWMYKTKLFIKI